MTPPFLISALDGGELETLLSGRFTPGTFWTVGLEIVEKRKILTLLESNLGHPANRWSINNLEHTQIHVLVLGPSLTSLCC
jgi:hypothetical protein